MVHSGRQWRPLISQTGRKRRGADVASAHACAHDVACPRIIHHKASSDYSLLSGRYGSHVNQYAYNRFNHWPLSNRGQETITTAQTGDPLKEMSQKQREVLSRAATLPHEWIY